MSSILAHAGAINDLTEEQRLAAASPRTNLFIEAGPGTGKTTVSAQRYGVQRFAPAQRYDHRAVVAVSFTRAATYNLRRRVQRLWGPTALAWPHRIVTLDTIVSDLVHDLLRAGLLVWPNSDRLWPDRPVTLAVHDSWAAFGQTSWNAPTYTITVAVPEITIHYGVVRQGFASVPADVAIAQLRHGVCTHQDVRDILEQAMADRVCTARVQQRLAETMRTLIVDEIFDANDLDIAIIETAIGAGIGVTLVGCRPVASALCLSRRPASPRAAYARASPDPHAGAHTVVPLARRTPTKLALDLRAGRGVILSTVPADDLAEVDVVLAVRWQDLWDLTGGVLPLAFGGFRGSYEEAATTLLLNHVTRTIVDLDAVYLNDALTALALPGREVLQRLEHGFQDIIEILRCGGPSSAKAAYLRLAEVVATVSPRGLRSPRKAYTDRLAQIQERLASLGRLVPGLTTHQAKGGEWNVVGVKLTDGERAALAGGLSVDEDMHRKLYVACTRARRRTVEVRPAGDLLD